MQKLNILILEDDGMIALHISQIVEKLNCEVLDIVTNYNDAIDIANQYHIDLLIADIKIIGEIDGIQTASVLQKLYSCDVIFLTANIDELTLQNASKVRSLGYLVKPFKEVELLAILKMNIERFKQKEKQNIVLSKEYTYDKYLKKLYFNEKEVNLSKNEKKLFNLLTQSLNNTVTYEYMDEVIWYDRIATNNNRRQLIHKLKKKLPILDICVLQDLGIRLNTCVNLPYIHNINQ